MHRETCLKRNLGKWNLSLPENFHSPKNVEYQESQLQALVLNGTWENKTSLYRKDFTVPRMLSPKDLTFKYLY